MQNRLFRDFKGLAAFMNRIVDRLLELIDTRIRPNLVPRGPREPRE